MQNLRIYTRYGSYSSIYLNIARKEWQEYVESFEKLDRHYLFRHLQQTAQVAKAALAEFSGDFVNIVSMNESRKEHLVKSLIFGTMSLEAFIYDYAAHYLTDTYVKKYLDKLDVVSKWVIVVRVVTGTDFPTGSQAFQHLKELVSSRNKLVHAKSHPMPKDLTDFITRYGPELKKELEMNMPSKIKSPYETVIKVLTELRKLEGENEIGTQWWQLEAIQ
jgi:hypothetical protein